MDQYDLCREIAGLCQNAEIIGGEGTQKKDLVVELAYKLIHEYHGEREAEHWRPFLPIIVDNVIWTTKNGALLKGINKVSRCCW